MVASIAFSCIRSTHSFQCADSNAVTRSGLGTDASSRDRSVAHGQPRSKRRASMIARQTCTRFASAQAMGRGARKREQAPSLIVATPRGPDAEAGPLDRDPDP